MVLKEGEGTVDADRQWMHDNVHAAAVGVLHDSATSKTLPAHHARVRIGGDLARAFPAPEQAGAGLPRIAVHVLPKRLGPRKIHSEVSV